MARPQQFTAAQVIAALDQCNGLIFLAAGRLGCTTMTVRNYAHRYPSVRAAIEEKRGKRLDVAEAKLDQAVLDGEAWAVQFLLRTQGKHRGYGDSRQLEHLGRDGRDLYPVEAFVAAAIKHARESAGGSANGERTAGA
jgi:hypothetical protein